MAHTIYDNFFLANEIQDLYASHLALQNFCKVNNDLAGSPGMTVKINRYTATSATEELEIGNGNTGEITVSYDGADYKILLAQTRFIYHDEEEMTDPMIVLTGTQKMGADLFDFVNGKIYGAFGGTSQEVSASTPDFAAFADAVALLNIDGTDNDPAGINAFAFVCPADMATVRKALGDELKYVEAFVRSGYVGTAAGVNLYVKKDATAGTIYVATNEAVTLFNKPTVEFEQERDGNTRTNTLYARKAFVAALTDETKAVKITVS